MGEWRRALLRAIGARPTPQNLRFLSNWQRWEGGHTNNDARYNWLNTTHGGPGVVGSINSVGVKAFQDFQSGIHATAATLLNGRYDDIVAGLKSGNPYAQNLDAGLSTWVSGSPTARLDYARKVMGGAATPKAAQPRGGRGPTGNPGLVASPPSRLPSASGFTSSGGGRGLGAKDALVDDVWGDLAPLFRSTFGPDPVQFREEQVEGHFEAQPKFTGRKLVLPKRWKSTHPTDGLEDQGFRSAVDIMARAGTPVGAPEAGTVIRWGSAQGGSSIWFRADSGRLYWMGHLDNVARPGTRVRRGQVIARVSADHPRPHVHLDVQT